MDNLELPQLDVEALAKTIIYALQGALRDDLREVENRYRIRIDLPINGALARTAEMVRESVQQFDGVRSEYLRSLQQHVKDLINTNPRQPFIVPIPQDASGRKSEKSVSDSSGEQICPSCGWNYRESLWPCVHMRKAAIYDGTIPSDFWLQKGDESTDVSDCVWLTKTITREEFMKRFHDRCPSCFHPKINCEC